MTSNDSPRVIGTGTALPDNYVDQEQLTSRLRELWERRHSDLRRFDKLQAALGITGLMLGAIFMVHLPNGFFMNWMGNQKGEGFEYHLLAIGLAVALLVRGAGAFSLDRLLSGSSVRE